MSPSAPSINSPSFLGLSRIQQLGRRPLFTRLLQHVRRRGPQRPVRTRRLRGRQRGSRGHCCLGSGPQDVPPRGVTVQEAPTVDGISPGQPGVATPHGTETLLPARDGQGAVQSTRAKRSGNTGGRGQGERDPIRTRARATKTNGEREREHRVRGSKSEARRCTWRADRFPPEA